MTTAAKLYLAIGLVIPLTTAVASADTPKTSSSTESSSAPSAVHAERKRAAATVEKVDTAHRRLTLRDQSGEQFTVTVPEQVQRLNEIKPGDRIRVDYYEAVGISLEKGGTGAPSAEEHAMISRGATKLPSGHMARQFQATAEVTKVDRAKDTVSFQGPNGETQTLHVTTPAAKQALSQLQQGDRIKATYTEAVAVAVERPAKQPKPETTEKSG